VTAAREAVLGRIRAALADVGSTPAHARADVVSSVAGPDAVERFVREVRETGATVLRPATAREGVDEALAAQDASRVVVAADLDAALRPTSVEAVVDDSLAPGDLDALDGAVTTCAAACADTGTIAFDGGPGQGRRAITLVPDLHVCVVREEQVVATVPELFARLEASARDGRPLVLVSGPSATSDIGFERVEGVHGPRRLVVVLVR
jgi:L-lactate dehydrogenase complex protein LldG